MSRHSRQMFFVRKRSDSNTPLESLQSLGQKWWGFYFRIGLASSLSRLKGRECAFLIYARHGEATVGEDQPYLNFQYCHTQKNLSEAGRSEAVYYGKLLRYWQILISTPIIASPFCRTIETAHLAFPYAPIRIDPFWLDIYKLSGNISKDGQTTIVTNLESMVEMKPPPGTNIDIIAHSFPKGIGLGEIANMGTVIIKPRGQGNGYEVVRKLTLADLANLANLGSV